MGLEPMTTAVTGQCSNQLSYKASKNYFFGAGFLAAVAFLATALAGAGVGVGATDFF